MKHLAMGLSFHLRRSVKCATDTVVTGQATFVPKNERTPYASTSISNQTQNLTAGNKHKYK
jgi:hypothetical protein